MALFHTNPLRMHVSACLGILLLLTFVLSSEAGADNLKNGEVYVLTILHTNDFHGHVDRLPQYATLIREARKQYNNLLVLEGGDLFLRGEFDGLSGEPEMALINEMGYDAWVIGNNDFRVSPEDHTPVNPGVPYTLIAGSKAKTLCANVLEKDSGKLLKGVEPYIIKNLNGVKVGIIGLTSTKPQDRGYEPTKIFLDPADTLKKYLAELKGKTDINIVLSHCSLSRDVDLLYQVSGFSAILGADDHFRMETPIYWVWDGEKSSPIVQHGGEEDHVLGRLELTFQKMDGQLKLINFRGDALKTDFVPGDARVQELLDSFRDKSKAAPGKFQEAA